MSHTNHADGRTVEWDVPTMDGASMEVVLYCIELFNNFCHILCGAAKDDLDSVIAQSKILLQRPF
jgi:hypothetical protein